jgi:aryl-alcohol dehydrogenase-like predicted oxidoreductase
VARFSEYLKSDNPRVQAQATRFVNDKTLHSTAKYMEIAKKLEISPVTLAVAYSKQFDFVASTIIGATNAEQLDASLAAMNLTLSDEILKACDKVHEEILYPMG